MARPEAAIVRPAQAGDAEKILDLLTHYDLPRSHFEPQYRADPCYRPEHSWVAEVNGSLVAHLRLFPRTLRLGTTRMPVAGIGNVVTARDHRGKGHTRRLLTRALQAMEHEPYAYAMLWTHVPQVYTRHGFGTLPVDRTRAIVPPHPEHRCAASVFRPSDLPEVERFARRYGAALSGTIVRSLEYWRGQLLWLDENPEGFLVARDRTGELIGYIRSRSHPGHAEILELAILHGDHSTARTLLAAATRPHGGSFEALLPPSQRYVLGPDSRPQVTPEPGPMLRLLNAKALAKTLSRRLSARLMAVGPSPLDILIDPSVESARALYLKVGPDAVRISGEDPPTDAPRCTPAEFARLMLGGTSPGVPEPLRRLFPTGDWVLWDADRV